MDLIPDSDGFPVKTVQDRDIYVLPMLFNDRIVTFYAGDHEAGYDRYWCYPKGGAAFLAAMAWEGTRDTEPVGWTKAHGERYPTKMEV